MWKYYLYMREKKLLAVWQGGESFSDYSREYRIIITCQAVYIYIYMQAKLKELPSLRA